jgi:hypothetical protein
VKAVGYRILIQGSLGPDWADWFDGMEIRAEGEGRTALEGPVADQAALHGLLARLQDLNLPLISVLPSPEEGASRHRKQGGRDASAHGGL